MQVAFPEESVGGQEKLVMPTLAELYNHIVGKVIPTVAQYLG